MATVFIGEIAGKADVKSKTEGLSENGLIAREAVEDGSRLKLRKEFESVLVGIADVDREGKIEFLGELDLVSEELVLESDDLIVFGVVFDPVVVEATFADGYQMREFSTS